MGTVVVQDISQSKLDSIFIGMEGVTGIADDMVIVGRDKMEHDRNFLAFMEKCMSNNLTLNSEKIQFKQTQVSFYGHCWSKHGISPDPKKIQALNHMEFLLGNLHRSPAQLYRLHIFNKLEVSKLDSRLSLFIIISLYIHTLPLFMVINV